jgi:hypothetical protein
VDEETRVVWISHKDGERCAGCGDDLGSGRFIQLTRETGIRCMKCAGYGDLVFLASGDAALTRRATAFSARHVVVVKFSRARKRNERQGVLVEEQAVERAEAASAKEFEPKAVELAVRARIRHRFTKYDELLFEGMTVSDARAEIRPDLDRICDQWRSGRQQDSIRHCL